MEKKPGERDKKALQNAYQQMYNELMDVDAPSEQELYDTQSASQGICMGKYRKKFAKVPLRNQYEKIPYCKLWDHSL